MRYQMVEGVVRIPVRGTLHWYSGMAGDDGRRAALSMTFADDAARAVVLDIDNPGGEVAGCFDRVDSLYAVRGSESLRALLNEFAYSAAYALGSAM
jgi:ClpP class serine protease